MTLLLQLQPFYFHLLWLLSCLFRRSQRRPLLMLFLRRPLGLWLRLLEMWLWYPPASGRKSSRDEHLLSPVARFRVGNQLWRTRQETPQICGSLFRLSTGLPKMSVRLDTVAPLSPASTVFVKRTLVSKYMSHFRYCLDGRLFSIVALEAARFHTSSFAVTKSCPFLWSLVNSIQSVAEKRSFHENIWVIVIFTPCSNWVSICEPTAYTRKLAFKHCILAQNSPPMFLRWHNCEVFAVCSATRLVLCRLITEWLRDTSAQVCSEFEDWWRPDCLPGWMSRGVVDVYSY